MLLLGRSSHNIGTFKLVPFIHELIVKTWDLDFIENVEHLNASLGLIHCLTSILMARVHRGCYETAVELLLRFLTEQKWLQRCLCLVALIEHITSDAFCSNSNSFSGEDLLLV